ncbi:MAG: pimeloyl-ACP methyl ester carboxylesterase [Candidatus Woesearchaeota archaeon]|jgi:pimeloyl-ACP methyl ester carboxylesterase
MFIQNRKGLNISVDVTVNGKEVVFIMHGLGGSKAQLQVQASAQAHQERGYTTVVFDTTNSFGESGGKYEDATLTNYYHDLQDVISWAKSQPWYQEPFSLLGHSLGGTSVVLFAEENPTLVKQLIPVAPVVSGKRNISKYSSEVLTEWERTGLAYQR